jgi:hypothetical protein
VRLAVLISLAALAPMLAAVRADDSLMRAPLGSHTGYIVPETYAAEYKTDFVSSIPGAFRIDGFWTPSKEDVAVADRVFLDLIHAAAKDPTLLFPDLAPSTDPTAPVDAAASQLLARQKSELALISDNYSNYSRQYVGIIVDGQQLVFCNYSEGTNLDPAKDYIYLQKAFAPEGAVHFLQCRFDPVEKTCANVSFIGSWQVSGK